MAFVIVALDGPTGVGKSTLARQLAERNQLLYVNTGSMCRCLAWKWNRLDKPENEEALQELGEQTQIVLEADGRVFCDHEEISSAIRTEEVSALASQVSRFVPIRQALKFQQRQLVEQSKIGGVYRLSLIHI